MKKLDIDFIKKELISEAYDFTNKRREKAITSNYKQAKVFLGAYGTPIAKDVISKIKSGEDVSKKELENTLLAIHIFKKLGASKKNYKVKQQAIDVLKKNGIDLITRTEDDEKLLKQAQKLFRKKHKIANPEKEITEPSAETPTEAPAAKPDEIEEPEDEEPEEAEPEKIEKPEPKESKKLSVSLIVQKINTMKKETMEKFANKFDIPVAELMTMIESEELNEEASKFKVGQIERYLRKFSKTMDTLARKAREMPSTAQDRLHSAETEASKAFFRSIRLASPSALNILKGRIQETGKGTIEKIKGVSQRASEKIKASPTAQLAKSKWEQMKEKGSATYKKAKEYGKEKAGQAFEKVISKAEAKGKGEKVPEQKAPKEKTDGFSKMVNKIKTLSPKERKRIQDEEKRKKLQKKFISAKKEPLRLPSPKVKISKI